MYIILIFSVSLEVKSLLSRKIKNKILVKTELGQDRMRSWKHNHTR